MAVLLPGFVWQALTQQTHLQKNTRDLPGILLFSFHSCDSMLFCAFYWCRVSQLTSVLTKREHHFLTLTLNELTLPFHQENNQWKSVGSTVVLTVGIFFISSCHCGLNNLRASKHWQNLFLKVKKLLVFLMFYHTIITFYTFKQIFFHSGILLG